MLAQPVKRKVIATDNVCSHARLRPFNPLNAHEATADEYARKLN